MLDVEDAVMNRLVPYLPQLLPLLVHVGLIVLCDAEHALLRRRARAHEHRQRSAGGSERRAAVHLPG